MDSRAQGETAGVAGSHAQGGLVVGLPDVWCLAETVWGQLAACPYPFVVLSPCQEMGCESTACPWEEPASEWVVP